MLFRNEESSLRLDIVNYEFPPDGGDPTSDDRNWLVLRATWNKEDGDVVKDSNSCLLTHELQSMSAGLKVLKAGIRDVYVSDFQENFYFSVGARALGDGTFEVVVSFYLPNTMDCQHRSGGRLHLLYRSDRTQREVCRAQVLGRNRKGDGGADRRTGPALRKIPGSDLKNPGAPVGKKVNRLEL